MDRSNYSSMSIPNGLLAQAPDEYSCSQDLFVCTHDESEYANWNRIVENHLPVSLALAPWSRERGAGRPIPLESYNRIKSLRLDHLGLLKLVYLIGKCWNYSSTPDRPRVTRNPRDVCSFESREKEFAECAFGRGDYMRAKMETALSGVRLLVIELHDFESPWSKLEGDCAFVPDFHDIGTQRQIGCIAKCMPSLERVKISREIDPTFLNARLFCRSWKNGQLHEREGFGWVATSDLAALEREIERFLVERPRKQSSLGRAFRRIRNTVCHGNA